MSLPKRLVGLALLGLVVTACGGGEEALPTNAPLIPPTHTATPPPSPTFVRPPATLNPLTPTPNLRQPSWTPRPSDTPLPTRTPPPSSTPIPTTAPPERPSSGLETLRDGGLRLVVSAEEVNLALADAPYEPSLTIEPDGVRVKLALPNDFLNQTTQIRAQVTTALADEGLTLTLEEFESEGPTVTRAQVRAALEAVALALNADLRRRMEKEVTFTRFELASGFLTIEGEPK